MKHLTQTQTGDLIRNTSYQIDHLTMIGETVYLMPFFVRLLNGLGTQKELRVHANRYWHHNQIHLNSYAAIYTGVTICERFAVLQLCENGQEIKVHPSFFSKRFGCMYFTDEMRRE